MIILPSRIEGILQRDRLLHSAVESSLAQFDSLLQWSTLPFFPEYTDHGVNHLSDVFRTADALVTEKSSGLLTPRDACLIALSVLLHDAGMHLSETGFLALITDKFQHHRVSALDSKKWSELWSDFIAEAKRFDGKRLLKIFGSTEPIHIPPLDPEAFTLRDRRLIGEFIRRHHARLAHEIALGGMPGSENVGLSHTTPVDLRDLSGLIARSHGVELRSLFPYLETHYHIQEYGDAHPVFLMTVLRVADYLQVHPERAPVQHLRVSRLRSPLSQQEWKNHEAIVNITTQDDDPEAILIQARPQDVATFLRLKSLLRDLQAELDCSWAVLGEVYGRRKKLSDFGLELRRVKSNLDDVDKFALTVNYVPCKASFEAADAELLKLLAQPLYGTDPKFGVRELVQNAVDACLERWDLDPEEMKTLPADAFDVVVALTKGESGRFELSVEDRGIGMTVGTLREYFLRAGASYRRSEEWRKSHEDGSGHSRVLRSGRFGIGVLAAFVLGDKISVITRNLSEQWGVKFSASLDMDTIELQLTDAPVGTKISVELSDAVASRLSSDLDNLESKFLRSRSHFGELPDGLYLLDRPSVGISVGGRLSKLRERWPACGQDPLPRQWHRIYPKGYKEVQWTHQGGALACNGIAVEQLWRQSFPAVENLHLAIPSISVFDPDGNLPLTLTRTSLSTPTLPFEEELLTDICKDLAAYLITEPWQAKTREGLLPSDPARCDYAGFSTSSPRDFLCIDTGFTLLDPGITESLAIRRVVYGAFLPQRTLLPEFEAANTAIFVDRRRGTLLGEIDDWGRDQLGAAGRPNSYWGRIAGTRIYAHQRSIDRWRSKIPKGIARRVNEEAGAGDWRTMTVGKCGPPASALDGIAKWADENNLVKQVDFKPAFAEYHLDKQLAPRDSFLGRVFREVLGNCVIPYKMEDRKSQMPQAFKNLDKYIEQHAKLRPMVRQ